MIICFYCNKPIYKPMSDHLMEEHPVKYLDFKKEQVLIQRKKNANTH